MYEFFDDSMRREFARPDCEADPLDFANMCAIAFCPGLATFKDEAFKAEQEWRLATSVQDEWELRGAGIEYVVIPLVSTGLPLPIRSITVGPTAKPEIVERVRLVVAASR
jgi:hypothetical protein